MIIKYWAFTNQILCDILLAQLLFPWIVRGITEDCSDDFTVSYLDGVVVKALESEVSFVPDSRTIRPCMPYRPQNSWRWREKHKESQKMVISISNFENSKTRFFEITYYDASYNYLCYIFIGTESYESVCFKLE